MSVRGSKMINSLHNISQSQLIRPNLNGKCGSSMPLKTPNSLNSNNDMSKGQIKLEREIASELSPTKSSIDIFPAEESKNCTDTFVEGGYTRSIRPKNAEQIENSVDESAMSIPIESCNSSFSQSDISDEGRLIIADFSKNDSSDTNICSNTENNAEEDSFQKDAFANSMENTANLKELEESCLVQSPALKDFVIRQHEENIMSSTMHEDSCHSRLSIESDDSLPIQAEVVMSEGSDDEELKLEPPLNFLPPEIKMKYQAKSKDTFVEYLSSSLLKEKCNLAGLQMENSFLPPYVPTIDPPSWLKCTLPPNGYICDSCGDKFNIENSLIEHITRRSILITLNCNICQEECTFHNICTFKDHIKKHLLKNEDANKDDAIIQALPLDQIKLLQPIKISKYKPVHEKPIVKNKLDLGTRSDTSSRPKVDPKILSAEMTSEPGVRCYMCNENFENNQQLRHHLKTDQSWSDEKIECKKCRLVLPSLCSGKAHILIHSSSQEEPSVCPECGNQYGNQRDFVRHLNDCGHQFRKSGILCPECNVCFFHFVDDFLSHWINEHCSKYCRCFLCGDVLESPSSHNCKFSNSSISNVYKYVVHCPTCPQIFNGTNVDEDKEIRMEIKKHLKAKHPSIVSRVHYVFKSKFCCNAFKNKALLAAHHEKEHRKNNNFYSKNCSFADDVHVYLKKYFDGAQQRNSFVMLDLPQDHFSQTEPSQSVKLCNINKARKTLEKPAKVIQNSPQKVIVEPLQYDMLKPVHCYQCGYVYSSMKEFKRHSKICKQSVVSLSCDACNNTVRKSDFPQHCVSHIKDDTYTCMFCSGRQFESKLHLQTHFEMHANSQFIYPTNCIFCGYVMRDIASALEHVSDKHEMKSMNLAHECNHCGRKFHGARGLLVHSTKCPAIAGANTQNVSAKICAFCKRSTNAELFGKHIVHHLEDGYLICSICDGRHFESRISLLHHLEDHSLTLNFPYNCPICTLTMTDRTSCLQHLKDEHGFNNVKCTDCEMTYNYWFELRRHISIAHKECTFAKRRYICWICKAYDHVRKESVINHFRTKHNLTINEVNEQTDIRTRGFGSLPSTFFMPIKALGKKESPPKKENKPQPPQQHYTENEEKDRQKPIADAGRGNDIIIKQEMPEEGAYPSDTNDHNYFHELQTSALDTVIDNTCGNLSKLAPVDRNSPSKNSHLPVSEIKQEKVTTSESDSPGKGIKVKFMFENKDNKLKNKTKVVIKRMNKKSEVIHTKKSSKNDHLKKIFQCSQCKYKTYKKSKLDDHVITHDQDEKSIEGFYCSECGESFVVKLSLVRHLFFVHRIKQNDQSDLPRKPARSNGVAKRSKSVDEEDKKCRKRPKRRLSELHIPERKHFQCNICKENFPTSTALCSHLKTHGMAFLKKGSKRRSIVGESS